GRRAVEALAGDGVADRGAHVEGRVRGVLAGVGDERERGRPGGAAAREDRRLDGGRTAGDGRRADAGGGGEAEERGVEGLGVVEGAAKRKGSARPRPWAGGGRSAGGARGRRCDAGRGRRG